MSTLTDNRALTGAIVPTFVYYVIPATISLVAITTASLVDGMFIGNQVGADALAAITLLIPYFTLLFAFALMFAIGGAVTAGKAIGAGDSEAASAVFSQSMLMTLYGSVGFAIWSLFAEQWLMDLLSVPEPLYPLVSEYLAVIRWAFVLQLTTMVLYYFVRTDGHPLLATVALVAGALLNILLDAWFIMVLEWGLTGAAWATLLAQALQGLILLRFFISRRRTLHFTPALPDWQVLGRLTFNGLSESVNELSAGVIFWLLNSLMIASAGVSGVAAYSVVNYFIFVSLMLCYGIADALHLLVSQNYGAGQTQRVRQFFQISLLAGVGLGLVLVVLLLNWQQTAINWFVDSQNSEVTGLAAQLMTLVWPLFLINGANILISCYLTALHQPRPSAAIAAARSLVLPGVLLLLMYQSLSWLQQVWGLPSWSFVVALPIAEACALLLALMLLRHARVQPVAIHG